MINVLIKNGDRSTILSMPAGRREMAEKLYHIGINKPADKISCRGLSDPPINVELTGDTEMETKLIAVLTEWDTVGDLNGVLSRFYALPMQNRWSARRRCSRKVWRICPVSADTSPSTSRARWRSSIIVP